MTFHIVEYVSNDRPPQKWQGTADDGALVEGTATQEEAVRITSKILNERRGVPLDRIEILNLENGGSPVFKLGGSNGEAAVIVADSQAVKVDGSGALTANPYPYFAIINDYQ